MISRFILYRISGCNNSKTYLLFIFAGKHEVAIIYGIYHEAEIKPVSIY
jgi:hypothetical protein